MTSLSGGLLWAALTQRFGGSFAVRGHRAGLRLCGATRDPLEPPKSIPKAPLSLAGTPAPAPSATSTHSKLRSGSFWLLSCHRAQGPHGEPSDTGVPTSFLGCRGQYLCFFLHLLQLEQPGSHTRRKKEAGTPPAPVAERKARPSCGVPMAHRGRAAEDRAGGAAGRARGCPGPPRSCPNGVSAG